MWFLGFSNHEKGALRQEISKWSTVCSTFSNSGWSVVRSASLVKGGTSKMRPSPHLDNVPTRSNKVNPRTLQTALLDGNSKWFLWRSIWDFFPPVRSMVVWFTGVGDKFVQCTVNICCRKVWEMTNGISVRVYALEPYRTFNAENDTFVYVNFASEVIRSINKMCFWI
jgi:hypothetical protein